MVESPFGHACIASYMIRLIVECASGFVVVVLSTPEFCRSFIPLKGTLGKFSNADFLEFPPGESSLN